MDTRVPLVCEQNIWQAGDPCGEDERCDPAPGPKQGSCRRVAPECRDRDVGVPFCDAEGSVVVCNDGLQPVTSGCDENELCAEMNDRTRCVCAPGFADEGEGCRETKGCEPGSCDLLTNCKIDGDRRVCAPCPTGYTGEGQSGCKPTLLAILAQNAELVPEFRPGLKEYEIELPLLTQALTLSFNIPAGARVEVDGEPVPVEEPWVSPVLQIGERVFDVEVIAKSGLSESYVIRVKRLGVEDAYLKAATPAAGELFGYVVALSGDTLLITAPYDDTGAGGVNPAPSSTRASNSGAAYVFVREGGSWMRQAYLKASSPAANDFFGAGATIVGDTIVIGAIKNEPLFSVAPATRAGAVFVFERSGTSWAQTASFGSPASDPTGDMFGFSMVLSGDELYVGANQDNTGAPDSGTVFMFKRMGAGWQDVQQIKPQQPVMSSIFGTAVALEGDTLAVSAPSETSDAQSRGAVYMFERENGLWVERQRLATQAPAASVNFGFALALSGNTLVAGAPHYDILQGAGPGSAHVFMRGAEGWTPSAVLEAHNPRDSDSFGFQVALLGDTLAVTASADDSGAQGLGGDPSRTDGNNSGAVYLYARRGLTWQRSTYLKASNAGPSDGFGWGVALSADRVVVSAQNESSSGAPDDDSAEQSGAAYVFR